MLPHEAIDVLQALFNHTLSAGYFPETYKTAILKFIPKSNTDPTNPINYRPISLLEVTGKILEKIINKRLRNTKEECHNLPHNQHGYRVGRGTDTAITTIYETIAHYTSQKDQCYIILRDVSKAFDKVWHEGLKYKLLHLNLPDTLTRLICTFITNRTAKIKIGTYLGPPIQLLSGVPQGS